MQSIQLHWRTYGAVITGPDPTYGFKRDFLKGAGIDVGPGIYDVDRQLFAIIPDSDGILRRHEVTRDIVALVIESAAQRKTSVQMVTPDVLYLDHNENVSIRNHSYLPGSEAGAVEAVYWIARRMPKHIWDDVVAKVNARMGETGHPLDLMTAYDDLFDD